MILQRSFSISILGIRRFSSTTSNIGIPKFIWPSRRSLIAFAIQPQSSKNRAFGTAAVVTEDRDGSDTFFAEETISWGSLGVSESVTRALSNIGLQRPSLVQVPKFSCFYKVG